MYAFACARLGWRGQAAEDAVQGFGCSDCRCRTHLHYFREDPTERLRSIALAPGVQADVVWQRSRT